ncbi:MAG: bifunctional LLM class flavin-dependent oxidoreductase/SDR family oxidoreductase [Myxococcota bacterium]
MTVKQALDCGVMFFSASAESTETNKYELVIETAKYADQNGFSSIWVPERHFTLLGGLYPNPSVLQAALAMVTQRIQLRAGSVVLPLHNPLRVAEEWAMVDNLSRGRVGVSFASGWHPTDFTFFPERYEGRQDALFDAIPIVHRLWRGESLTVKSGTGKDAQVGIFPRPLQKELPTWVTAAGNPQTYARVGTSGANLLTHLLDQGTEALAKKISLYREARAESAHDPHTGRVSIMIHTFLGADPEIARETARRPFCDFLKLNAGLLNGLAKARGRDMDFSRLSAADQEEFVQFIYERFVDSRAFIGSPRTCVGLANELYAAGVDELLFLLDFGPSYAEILAGLPYLTELKELCKGIAPESRTGVSAGVTTPGRAAPELRELALEDVRARCDRTAGGDQFYEALAARGIHVDASLRTIRDVYWREGEALACASLGENHQTALALELCSQTSLLALAEGRGNDSALLLPVSVQDVDFTHAQPGLVWCHASRRSDLALAATRIPIDVRLLDEAGKLLASSRLELERVELPEKSAIHDAAAEKCLHALEWQPARLAQVEQSLSAWLILCDELGIGAALAHVLTKRGHACSVLRQPGIGTESLSFAEDVAGFRAAIRELGSKSELPLRGVIHLWGLDATPTERTSLETLEVDSRRGLGSALAVMKVLAELEAGGNSPRLWLVTQGAQAVRTPASAPESVAVAQAPLWGLGQTFSVEHRNLFGALVDLDPKSESTMAANSVLETLQLGDDDREDLIAFRDGDAHVARLVARHERLQTVQPLREDATYLVTGGFGGIGRVTAEWLAANGAKHIALLGRNVPPPREEWDTPAAARWATAIATIRALEQLGVNVVAAGVDVGAATSWRAFLEQHESGGRPAIRGVFHTAGTLRPQRLLELDLDSVREAFCSKVFGTWQLHEAFSARQLDLFVTFSSAPPHLGVLGQSLGSYNAANAFMDALAQYRGACGLPATNIKWGPWSQVGLHTHENSAKSNLERLAAFGLKGISNRDGMDLLGHVLSAGIRERWVLAADWARLFESDFLIADKPLFSALVSREALDEAGQLLKRRAEFVSGLMPLPSKVRHQRLVAELRDLVVEVMRLEPASVDWRRGLFDMGMDSLMALELKTKLQNHVGLSISATLAFDYPTVDAIAGYLEAQLFSAQHSVPESGRASQSDPVSMTELQLDALDEEQLEAALLAKLESI